MNPRDRVLAALRGETVDRLPFTIYDILMPSGQLGEMLKKMDLTVVCGVSVFREEWPNVKVRRVQEGDYVYTTYETPVGSVRMKHKVNLQPGTGDSWMIEHPIKKPEDYKVVNYIFKNSIIKPLNLDEILRQLEIFREGYVVRTGTDRTPIQKMLIELTGYRRLAIDLYENPELVDELYEILAKRIIEMCDIIADSPLELVWCPDNVNGIVLGPKIFQKYHQPLYKRMSQKFKINGKIFMVHMDGKLNCLKESIARSDIDVVEAFTPPPMGDLSVREARSLWGRNMKIWINFPESIFLENVEHVRRYTLNLLEEIMPDKGFLIGITEDVAPGNEEKLRIVAEVLDTHGRYLL